MKIEILCRIEAEIKDTDEITVIKESLKSPRQLLSIRNLWRKIIKEKINDLCPNPTYGDSITDININYFEEDKEHQLFQLGDTAYMIDEDFRFFESIVYKIELSYEGEYYYDSYDMEFSTKDIGKRVFKSEIDRQIYLETQCY